MWSQTTRAMATSGAPSNNPATPHSQPKKSSAMNSSAREYGPDDTPDDVRGHPAGHFVVLAGYDEPAHKMLVVDPYQSTPFGPSRYYWLPAERVLGAILLGIVTHDANMLVISPRSRGERR